ncbi:anti-sigma factor [Hanstruepera neustonica]|uniref:Anti-sigma factor n=1 Tax=Hanstruepera neustonica TaxID=1445657 RepID=A0A2K1DZH6_9FLAO|nr:FecR family protein [Hanstruepera neustonica]PNQ73440.1 anti-sigma factor [Hanstruepera neustonica]
MDREYLIKKWLDHDLNAEELQAFQALDDYRELTKLSNSLEGFKAPDFDSESAYLNIQDKISLEKSKISWFKPFLRIASIIAVLLAVYFYTTTLDTTTTTYFAEKTEIYLPDQSKVSLNAQSQLTYNKHDWQSKRDVNLNGEAYFDVEKGSEFNVITDNGTVTVLGTEFNVKNRPGFFETVCYEGSVKVISNNQTKILKPGDQFLIIDGNYIAQEKEKNNQPSWLQNESYFKSIPYKYVLREFERQYHVTFNTESIDTDKLYTGSFVHNDQELALKAITLPLNINFTIKNSVIVLNRE